MEKVFLIAVISSLISNSLGFSYLSKPSPLVSKIFPSSVEGIWNNYAPVISSTNKTFSFFSYPISSKSLTLTYLKCNNYNCELVEKSVFDHSSRDFKREDGFNSSVEPKIEIMDNSLLVLTRVMNPKNKKNKNIKINILHSFHMENVLELSYKNIASFEVYTENENFFVFYTSADESDECYQVVCKERFYKIPYTSALKYGKSKEKLFPIAKKTENLEFTWKPIISRGPNFSSYLLTFDADHLSHNVINTLYRIDFNLTTHVLLRSEGNNMVYFQNENYLIACYKNKSTPIVICRQYRADGATKNFEVNIDQFSSTWETDQIAIHKNGDAVVLLLLNKIEDNDSNWIINNFTMIEIYPNGKPPMKIVSKQVNGLKCSKKDGIEKWTAPVPTVNIFEKKCNPKIYEVQFVCSYFNETENKASDVFLYDTLVENPSSYELTTLPVPHE